MPLPIRKVGIVVLLLITFGCNKQRTEKEKPNNKINSTEPKITSEIIPEVLFESFLNNIRLMEANDSPKINLDSNMQFHYSVDLPPNIQEWFEENKNFILKSPRLRKFCERFWPIYFVIDYNMELDLVEISCFMDFEIMQKKRIYPEYEVYGGNLFLIFRQAQDLKIAFLLPVCDLSDQSKTKKRFQNRYFAGMINFTVTYRKRNDDYLSVIQDYNRVVGYKTRVKPYEPFILTRNSDGSVGKPKNLAGDTLNTGLVYQFWGIPF